MNIKPDFRDICQLNVDALVDKVGKLCDDDWYADAERQKTFAVHKDTQSIRLVDNIKPGVEKAKVHPLYSGLKQEIAPVLTAIKRNIDSRVGAKKLEKEYGKSCFVRIVLARLNGKSSIPKHKDTGPSLVYVHRVHCPLITSSECKFRVGKSTRVLGVGEVTEINNCRIHAVNNDGAEKRVHLIVDYYVPGERIRDVLGNPHICKI